MRIAISGTTGKTEVVENFVKKWDKYKHIKYEYPEEVDLNNYSKKSQWAIVNEMCDKIQSTRSGDNVIFDSCPLDYMVHTLRAFDKENNDVNDKFVNKSIPLVRESLKIFDIIFFIPMTNAPSNMLKEISFEMNIKIDKKEEDIKLLELDNLYKALQNDYFTNDYSKFFVKDDKAPLIEIFGDITMKMAMIQQYIDDDGDAIGETSIIDPNTMTFKDLEQNINMLDPDVYV